MIAQSPPSPSRTAPARLAAGVVALVLLGSLVHRPARADAPATWDPATPPARVAIREARLGDALRTRFLPAESARFAAGLAPAAMREAPTVETTNQWSVVPPPARWAHSTMYDPLRDRVIVFGGQGYTGASAEVWALSLTGPPHWAPILPTGTGPGPRLFHCAVYDSLHDRMLVFGGVDANNVQTNGVWALSFAGNPSWAPLPTAGTPPSARQWSLAVYDRARNRMLVMGGQAGATILGDVWALSLGATPTWTQLSTAAGPSPGGRAGHAGVYDALHDRLVIFAGIDASSAPKNDAWALALAGTPTWSLVAATGAPPAARLGASAVYDRIRDRLVMFAGGTGAPNFNDLWSLSLGASPAWTHFTPAGPPEGRTFHGACYDPIADRMLVFGGSSGPILSDTWSIALAAPTLWIPLSCTRREDPAALYDPARGRMVVFGGEDDVLDNDVWDLSLGSTPTWERLAPGGTPPAPRTLFAAGYDTKRDRMVIFGGKTDAGSIGDAWELTFSGELAWNTLAPTGTPPSPREDCASAYDSGHDRLIVFGGADAGGVYNDVWALGLVGPPTWTKLVPSGTAPAARGGASAIYDAVRDRLVVFGGYDKSFNALGDAWSLALAGTPAWTKIPVSGTAPAPRLGAPMIDDTVRDRVVIHGGTDFTSYFADTWSFPLFTGTPGWNALAFSGETPIARSDHRAIYDPPNDRMVLFGGESSVGVLHDAWTLVFGNTVDVAGDAGHELPGLALAAPFPSPARAGERVTFTFAVPAGATDVSLAVYDVRGRRVARLVDASGGAAGAAGPGQHACTWDGQGEAGGRAPAGVYFVRGACRAGSVARKFVLAR